ncbi:pseudouridylate synthase [Erysipelothrix larvae]|uniref:Pseudouridine synthase n=1 Tax=Erysipelothrix larvae TaxID=1514105 RepID=A0A109UGZ7_9FIRM|nr:pseudouridine synthase [Erysipelothrix larvae]AMC93391.1 pseudouridylate synthase [Erysipelothrix larvae]
MSSSNEIRLQKAIADAGVCSRRKAETLILDGKVKVNGVVVKELGVKVLPQDKITVDNKPIIQENNRVYYLLNKPRGVLSSASDTHDRPTVIDIVHDQHRLYPIGRLDMDTTGALILTNDGAFAQLLTHPKYHVKKSYRVSVKGKLPFSVSEKLRQGVTVDGVSYQGMEVEDVRYIKKADRTAFTLILSEGKNRQIRKVMEHFKLPVVRLHRFAIGPVTLDGVGIGQYRDLKPFEIKKLSLMAKGEL